MVSVFPTKTFRKPHTLLKLHLRTDDSSVRSWGVTEACLVTETFYVTEAPYFSVASETSHASEASLHWTFLKLLTLLEPHPLLLPKSY